MGSARWDGGRKDGGLELELEADDYGIWDMRYGTDRAFVTSWIITFRERWLSSSTFSRRSYTENACYHVNALLVDSCAAQSSDDA